MYYSSYHFYFYEVRLGVCSMNSKYTSVVGSPRTHVKHAKVQEGLHLPHSCGGWFSLFLFWVCGKNVIKMKLKTNTSVLVLYVCYCRIARIAVYWRLAHVCSGDKTKGTQICTNEKKLCIMSQMSERERELSVFRCSTSLFC